LAGTVSDSELRARVEFEYPEVVNADDWDRIRLLREYSYRHTAYVTLSGTISDELGFQNLQDVFDGLKSLGDGYAFFDDANGGVLCAGAAWMLMRLHQLFGYTASLLWLGWYEGLPSPSGSDFTHAQELATIQYMGKMFRVVNDPVTNFTYTTSDGAPIDYHDMVWLLAQNQADRISTSGAIGGAGRNPRSITVGFYSDQPHDSDGLASATVDPEDFVLERSPEKWVYRSPRTTARMELLGDVWWKPQLVSEGWPGETIYLHMFPSDPTGTSGSLVETARRILADLTRIEFSHRAGFGGIAGGPAVNAVSASMNARFSLANDACTNSCGVGLYPTPGPDAPDDSHLYFQPRNGSVAGVIEFPREVSSVDVDVTYFGGGTVTMTGYDDAGLVVARSRATDRAGHNHLGITAAIGRSIRRVILSGSNGGTALNVKNLQIRTLGPTVRFTHDEGFTSNQSINSVAASMNAHFSLGNDACANGCGVGLHPIPTSADRNSSSLYFKPRGNMVSGQITFPVPVSAVAVDIAYFGGGTVTMIAYDEHGNVLDQMQGSDQPGRNRLVVIGNPGSSRPIKSVRLNGENGGTAINIKNLMQFTWGD
jgi:hypothetical protein